MKPRLRSLSLSLALSLSLLATAACGDGARTTPTPDAPTADAAPACALAPTVARTQFVDESIAYLRAAFGIDLGFAVGTVAYGEGWVSLSDAGCPLADWTTLAYVTAIDPALVPLELRATHTRVAAVWALNGRRFVAFLPEVAGDAAPWWQGALPDNANAVARRDADPASLAALLADLATEHPTVRVTYLDAIGIVTLEVTIGSFASDEPATGRVPEIEAAVQRLRASNLFSSIEWSGPVVRIPFESFPAATVDDAELAPECLRTHTRQLRDDGVFTTLPAFAPPLGAGPTDHPAACE